MGIRLLFCTHTEWQCCVVHLQCKTYSLKCILYATGVHRRTALYTHGQGQCDSFIMAELNCIQAMFAFWKKSVVSVRHSAKSKYAPERLAHNSLFPVILILILEISRWNEMWKIRKYGWHWMKWNGMEWNNEHNFPPKMFLTLDSIIFHFIYICHYPFIAVLSD